MVQELSNRMTTIYRDWWEYELANRSATAREFDLDVNVKQARRTAAEELSALAGKPERAPHVEELLTELADTAHRQLNAMVSEHMAALMRVLT